MLPRLPFKSVQNAFGLAQFVLGLKHVGDLLHAQIFKSFAGGITGIRIPSFNIIEMGLKLIDPFFAEIEFSAVLDFPFAVFEYGQIIVKTAIGGAGFVMISRKILHFLMSALHHENCPFQSPGTPADFQPIVKGMVSAGDRIEECGLSSRSAPVGGEVAVTPIAEADRFFVIVPVMHVPGDPFGFVFGIDPGFISLISQPGVIEP